ncbi:MAG: hypothetical protein AAFO04_02130 [Cyanobacteria bacterium J06592_8]
MKITFTEVLLTATALVTTIGIHAQVEPGNAANTVELASLSLAKPQPLVRVSSLQKNTNNNYLCQSASLGLNKSLKSSGT